MKVFISWSGPRSKEAARVLREWLPTVHLGAQPWMSEEDIEKGERWEAQIAGELASTGFGIICVTPENMGKPWLNFEAGALSKVVGERTAVCTLLLGAKPSDVTGPLQLFQSTEVRKEDFLRLMATLDRAVVEAGEKGFASEAARRKAFERGWGELDAALGAVVKEPAPTAVPAKRSDRELLEEVVSVVRKLERRTDERRLSFPSAGNAMLASAGDEAVERNERHIEREGMRVLARLACEQAAVRRASAAMRDDKPVVDQDAPTPALRVDPRKKRE